MSSEFVHDLCAAETGLKLEVVSQPSSTVYYRTTDSAPIFNPEGYTFRLIRSGNLPLPGILQYPEVTYSFDKPFDEIGPYLVTWSYRGAETTTRASVWDANIVNAWVYREPKLNYNWMEPLDFSNLLIAYGRKPGEILYLSDKYTTNPGLPNPVTSSTTFLLYGYDRYGNINPLLNGDAYEWHLTMHDVITGIKVRRLPNITSYVEGQPISYAGLEVCYVTNGGSGEGSLIKDYTISPEEGSLMTSEDTVVAVSKDEYTTSFTLRSMPSIRFVDFLDLIPPLRTTCTTFGDHLREWPARFQTTLEHPTWEDLNIPPTDIRPDNGYVWNIGYYLEDSDWKEHGCTNYSSPSQNQIVYDNCPNLRRIVTSLIPNTSSWTYVGRIRNCPKLEKVEGETPGVFLPEDYTTQLRRFVGSVSPQEGMIYSSLTSIGGDISLSSPYWIYPSGSEPYLSPDHSLINTHVTEITGWGINGEGTRGTVGIIDDGINNGTYSTLTIRNCNFSWTNSATVTDRDPNLSQRPLRFQNCGSVSVSLTRYTGILSISELNCESIGTLNANFTGDCFVKGKVTSLSGSGGRWIASAIYRADWMSSFEPWDWATLEYDISKFVAGYTIKSSDFSCVIKFNYDLPEGSFGYCSVSTSGKPTSTGVALQHLDRQSWKYYSRTSLPTLSSGRTYHFRVVAYNNDLGGIVYSEEFTLRL